MLGSSGGGRGAAHPAVDADWFARQTLDLDRVVHEPARLAILTVLASADEVQFKFIEETLGLTRGPGLGAAPSGHRQETARWPPSRAEEPTCRS